MFLFLKRFEKCFAVCTFLSSKNVASYVTLILAIILLRNIEQACSLKIILVRDAILFLCKLFFQSLPKIMTIYGCLHLRCKCMTKLTKMK